MQWGDSKDFQTREEFFTWLFTTPPEGKSKSCHNGLFWYYCTKCKRNVPHETINCKSKTATARNKAKNYVAALTTVNAGSDNELVASVDMWGSEIDKHPKKKTKRNKGKGKTTKKNTKNRKVDNPLVSDSDIDTDSLYDVSENEDLE